MQEQGPNAAAGEKSARGKTEVLPPLRWGVAHSRNNPPPPPRPPNQGTKSEGLPQGYHWALTEEAEHLPCRATQGLLRTAPHHSQVHEGQYWGRPSQGLISSVCKGSCDMRKRAAVLAGPGAWLACDRAPSQTPAGVLELLPLPVSLLSPWKGHCCECVGFCLCRALLSP